jgi:DnaK suppressor protein
MTNTEPPIDPDRARELLRRERDRIESSLTDLERVRSSELEEIGSDAEPADDGGLIEEEEVDDAVAVQLRAELEAVERAEKRVEDGTYGFSVESGEPIPAQRLEAIPWAERTPAEQDRHERTHGQPL